MITFTEPQATAVALPSKNVKWVFMITDKNSAVYYYSTGSIAGVLNNIVLTDFSTVELLRNMAENTVIAPSEVTFNISNSGNALAFSDFKGGSVLVDLYISDTVDTKITSWLFRIKAAQPGYQNLAITAEDFLQYYLKGDYPNTRLPADIFPSNRSYTDETLCIPVPFGVAYIPLRDVFITDGGYIMLGSASHTYTISKIRSPRSWGLKSEYSSGSYAFTQSTKADANGDNWRVFQAIIADSSNDGVMDAAGVWLTSGGPVLDPPVQFTRDDTVSITNPADVINFVLQDMGIPVSMIDVAGTFAAAHTTFAGWGLTFNGAFWKKQDRQKVIAGLLNQCHSCLRIGEKIELHVLVETSRATITADDVLRTSEQGPGSFSYQDIVNTDLSDSAYVNYQKSGESQDEFVKVLVAVGDESTVISSEILECPFVQDSLNIQRIGRLYFQRKFLKEAGVGFLGKGTLLSLQPDDVITINDSNYGGVYDVLIDSVKITKDLSIQFQCSKFGDGVPVVMDNWGDITPDVIVIPEDTTKNITTPTAVTAIATTGLTYSIKLTLTYSTFTNFNAVEIWSSATNDRTGAKKVGETATTVWTHNGLLLTDTRYYWARTKDIYGNYGSWYPVSTTAGVSGSTSTNPADYLTILEGSITESQLYSTLNDRIDWIDTETFVFDIDLIEPNIVNGLNGAYSALTTIQGRQHDDIVSLTATSISQAKGILSLQSEVASLTTTDWSATGDYILGAYRLYSGTIYRCILAYTYAINGTKTPGVDTAYWEAADSLAILVSQINAYTTEIADSIIGPIAMLFSGGDRVVEHGIIVEDIADIFNVDVRITQAGIDIDGANAEIVLHAAEINSLDGRISQAEIDIDGAEAAILLKATQISLNATDIRVSAAEIAIDAGETADGILQSNIDLKVAITTYNTDQKTGGTLRIATAESNIGVLQTDSGDMQAQYTVKLNVNNRIAGFGLMLSGDTPSDFVIMADTFSIVNPNNNADVKVPFTLQNIGGTWTLGLDGDMVLAGTLLGNKMVASTITLDKLAFSDLAGLNATEGAKLTGIAPGATVNATFAQNAIPVSLAIGDMWVDTDDSNKMYRAASIGADAIAAGEWVLVRDSGIAAAIQAAADAQTDADTAQSTANTATTNAATANGLLADIASDSKVTPDEKQALKMEWDTIVAEKTVNDAQATVFGITTEKTTYGTKYTSLDTYINTTYPLFVSLTTTTAINNGDALRLVFKEYYDARTALLNAIATKAKTLADTAQNTANTAVTNAATAQAAAVAAQGSATAALNSLSDIASDVKITPGEKLTAKQLWDTIVVEGTATTGTIPVQALALSVADTDFDTDYAALNTYLNTTMTVFANMTTTTTIVRATWDTAWKNYYDERTKLLNAIAAKAATLAAWAGVSGAGKPADNATVGATWGTDLNSIPATLGAPSGSGLFLSSTYMGFYTASAWKTYIASDGTFAFSGDANNYVTWNGTTLAIKGSITMVSGSVPNASVTGLGSLALKSAVDLSTGDVTNKTATNIAYTGGATVDSLKPAAVGADVTSANTAANAAAYTGAAIATTYTAAKNTNPLADQTSINTAAAIASQGALATLNAADFATQVGGAQKPANNADVTLSAINGGLSITGGGITLSAGGAIKGGQTDYATGTGFFLGYSGAAYKFSIGSSTNYLTWDGSALTIKGVITATSGSFTGTVTATAGTIGGFTLSSTALYAGSGTTRIQLDTSAGIHLGATAFADAPFKVSLAGVLTAAGAVITGDYKTSLTVGTTKGIWLDPSTNQMYFYGDRGDATIEQLVSIGIITEGYNIVVGRFGTFNSQYIGVYGKSYNKSAVLGWSDTGAGVEGVSNSGYAIRGTGNSYFSANVSAGSFTDRTPYYEGDALAEIKIIKGKNGQIDHLTLPSFAQKKTTVQKKITDEKGKVILDGNGREKYTDEPADGRDIGAMVSILTVGMQQLIKKVEVLENVKN